ncbi:MAG: hypothetical protein WBG92_17815 [Thiohalocapsa sp.]
MSDDDKALLRRGDARSSPYPIGRLALAFQAQEPTKPTEDNVHGQCMPMRRHSEDSLGAVFQLLALVLLLLLVLPSSATAEPVELTISCGRFAEETERCRAAAQDWATATDNRVRVLSAPGLLVAGSRSTANCWRWASASSTSSRSTPYGPVYWRRTCWT